MERKHNAHLTSFARTLRKNMTKEEKHLWYDFLRTHPARFSRQKILGHYIADFYSPSAKLVIEIDGKQHRTEDGKEYDSIRTAFLEQYKLMVLRIPNTAINRNFKNVCSYIDKTINERFSATIPQSPDGDSSLYTREP